MHHKYIIIFTNDIIKLKLVDQANGANEDGTTFPGLGKIDYVLTEASVKIILQFMNDHLNSFVFISLST